MSARLLDEALGKAPAERTPGAFLELDRTHPDVAARKELLVSVLAALGAPDASAVPQRPAALVSLLHAVTAASAAAAAST
ncbi:hypothetical protein [Kineococcus indalonis]|uniref:hypothetical protein n=1 Tax=Kineococcus indalonis TaxID=2696566 RepID=UPI001412DE3B|nr:hypothetical protein [Kineococcus indalonis]NAZ86139.1 hypothetical protein [Kineococcus indalonis]